MIQIILIAAILFTVALIFLRMAGLKNTEHLNLSQIEAQNWHCFLTIYKEDEIYEEFQMTEYGLIKSFEVSVLCHTSALGNGNNQQFFDGLISVRCVEDFSKFINKHSQKFNYLQFDSSKNEVKGELNCTHEFYNKVKNEIQKNKRNIFSFNWVNRNENGVDREINLKKFVYLDAKVYLYDFRQTLSTYCEIGDEEIKEKYKQVQETCAARDGRN